MIRLTFTGDSTIGGEDRLEGKDYSFHGYVRKHGYGYPYANFREYFAQDDLTVTNLEGVLYDGTRGRADKPINFRGPTDYVNVLLEGSIEAAFLGNNHAMDYGAPGFEST
ncbi:MAG TPA: CapA family protein, partial [Candidatus Limnocylindria bacterium]|nr:CapA family protein [Candidatus Limnocylindria bacterium]